MKIEVVGQAAGLISFVVGAGLEVAKVPTPGHEQVGAGLGLIVVGAIVEGVRGRRASQAEND